MPFDSTAPDEAAAIQGARQSFGRDFYASARVILEDQKARRGACVSGVRWSGLDADLPRVQTLEDIAADLARKAKARADFAASPVGRFHRAAELIAIATHDERLLQCATRGVEHEIERASRLLAGMSGPAAETCKAALAEMAVAS